MPDCPSRIPNFRPCGLAFGVPRKRLTNVSASKFLSRPKKGLAGSIFAHHQQNRQQQQPQRIQQIICCCLFLAFQPGSNLTMAQKENQLVANPFVESDLFGNRNLHDS